MRLGISSELKVVLEGDVTLQLLGEVLGEGNVRSELGIRIELVLRGIDDGVGCDLADGGGRDNSICKQLIKETTRRQFELEELHHQQGLVVQID